MKLSVEEITFATVQQALDEGLSAIAEGETLIDLSLVRKIDSSAVAAALEWKRAAKKRGVSLTLTERPQALDRLIELYRLGGTL